MLRPLSSLKDHNWICSCRAQCFTRAGKISSGAQGQYLVTLIRNGEAAPDAFFHEMETPRRISTVLDVLAAGQYIRVNSMNSWPFDGIISESKTVINIPVYRLLVDCPVYFTECAL